MFKRMRKWFTHKTKTKVGRPKLAKKGVLKAAKIEVALAFLLVATVALAGTSTLTGRSPLELLSFGLASKASGNAIVGGGSVKFVCGSLGEIGTYKISSSSTTQSKDYATSHIGITNIPKTWVKSTNFNVNSATGTLTNSSFYVNIIRYELKNRAGTTICNGQFYNAGSNLKYKQITVNVTVNKGTFYAAINVSAEVKNKTTKDIHTADTSSGGHYSSEGLRIDNKGPHINGIDIFKQSSTGYDYPYYTKASIQDWGQLEGTIKYNVYRYSYSTGKSVGGSLYSTSNKYDSHNSAYSYIRYKHQKSTTSGQYITSGGTTYYPFMLSASVTDSLGNKGVGLNKCYLVSSTGAYYKTFTCGTKVSINWFNITGDETVYKTSSGERYILRKVNSGFVITAATTPSNEPVTWSINKSGFATITKKDNKSITLVTKKAGFIKITATARTGAQYYIYVLIKDELTSSSSTTITNTRTNTITNTRTNTTTKSGTKATSKPTTTATSKKQVDVSEIVGGVVITITPDAKYGYSPIKYGNKVPIHTTFTRTPSTLPARYRQWYTYYKNKASDKWVLNWGTKDSTTGQVAPCTLVKDTVGASPTLSINYKYRVGKWLIYSDSKCTKHLGSVLTPVYTAY